MQRELTPDQLLAKTERRASTPDNGQHIDDLAYGAEQDLIHSDWQHRDPRGVTVEQHIGEAMADDDALHAVALRCIRHCLRPGANFLGTGALEEILRKHIAPEARRLAELEAELEPDYEV